MGIPNIYGGEMKREITVGITLAGVTAALLLALPEPMAKGAVAILLSVIAAIYIGFSLASKGELPVIKQVAGAIGFILLAFLGLWFSWWFLVAGLALHGFGTTCTMAGAEKASSLDGMYRFARRMISLWRF